MVTVAMFESAVSQLPAAVTSLVVPSLRVADACICTVFPRTAVGFEGVSEIELTVGSQLHPLMSQATTAIGPKDRRFTKNLP